MTSSLGQGKSFSLAWVLDPLIQKRLGVNDLMGTTSIAQQKTFAQEKFENSKGAKFVESVKKWNPFGLNVLFATLDGDIGYQAAGLFPKRNHNVVQGVYAKLASKKENMWTGLLTADDLPSVLNPKKGYLVNTNNLIASYSKNEWGLSHAFSFNHRAVRISERLEDLINKAGERLIRVSDVQQVQQDLLDVQARESMAEMLTCVDEGLPSLNQNQGDAVKLALTQLKKWDFKYNVESTGAAIFEAWEFMIVSYMHEQTIDDVRLRRGIFSVGDSQMFIYR